MDTTDLLEQALEKQRRILGEEHPDTLTSMNNLATTYDDQGRLMDAARLHEQVLEKRRRILGEEHLNTLMSMYSLAYTYREQGNLTEALRLAEEALRNSQVNANGGVAAHDSEDKSITEQDTANQSGDAMDLD